MITETADFQDAEDIEIFLLDYLSRFHPAGYSTSIDEIKAIPVYENGKLIKLNYSVKVSRAESCD